MTPVHRPTHRSAPSRVGVAVASAAVAVVALASPAGAHELPGRGGLDGLAHPLLGADHLLAMVAVGVLAALVPAASGRRRVAWLVPTGFLAGMLVGGALGLAGVGLPGSEAVIGGSVVALGALVAVGLGRGSLARPAAWLPLLAVALGAAHGHAHGAEAPAGAVPALYVAGFVAATALLHLAGAGVGLALRSRHLARVAAGSGVAAAGALLLVGA